MSQNFQKYEKVKNSLCFVILKSSEVSLQAEASQSTAYLENLKTKIKIFANAQYDKNNRLPRKSCDLLSMTKNKTTPKQNLKTKDNK